MNNTAWLFDLDGTLVDSVNQIGIAINRVRREFGYRELTISAIQELVGLPIDFFLRDLRLNLAEEKEVIFRFREVLEIEILHGNQIFPGVEEFLTKLKYQGAKMGIATSKPTYLAKLVIKNSALNNLFDVIQGTEGFPAKPDPTSIQKAMLRLETNNAIMVGDRIEDIQAALAAGIDSIGIAHSFHNKTILEAAGAIYAFDTFLEFTHFYEFHRPLVGHRRLAT